MICLANTTYARLSQHRPYGFLKRLSEGEVLAPPVFQQLRDVELEYSLWETKPYTRRLGRQGNVCGAAYSLVNPQRLCAPVYLLFS
jgi:hypothetical protein